MNECETKARNIMNPDEFAHRKSLVEKVEMTLFGKKLHEIALVGEEIAPTEQEEKRPIDGWTGSMPSHSLQIFLHSRAEMLIYVLSMPNAEKLASLNELNLHKCIQKMIDRGAIT